MIDFFFLNKILILLVDTLGIWLGLWVYLTNRKARINQLFILMIIFALSWITLCYFSGVLTNNLKLSLFLGRLAYGVAILFFIPFYFFSIKFIKEEKQLLYLKIFIPIGSILIFFFSVFTDFMAKYMTPIRFGIAPTLGDGKFIYFGFVFFIALFVLIRLFLKYFKSLRDSKLKLEYFLLGFSVFIIANLIFNVILPFYEGVVKYYQIGNYSVIFLLGFTAYAIVKQQLFGIKVVLTALFVSLIAILLLLDALLFTSQFWLQVVKGGIIIFFLYLGYSLIKSVLKEIEEREKLEKLTEKLESAHIKLEAAYKKLKKLDEAKSEFLSIASHQLRTPLSAIKGYLSMFLEGDYGELSGKIKKPMENVYEANERLIKLVGNLLSVSRIEAGRIKMEFEKLSLEEIISSVVDELKIEAKKKNLKLVWKKPQKPLPKILLDKEKISEVLLNVIDNAIKYTNRGYVCITVNPKSSAFVPLSPKASEGRSKAMADKPSFAKATADKQFSNPKLKEEKIIIQIKDTGEGLTGEEISKLFQSFSRGTAGTRLYTEGVGLGLYISRRFVEMHNGKIWAESQGKGKGSTFYIELPVK